MTSERIEPLNALRQAVVDAAIAAHLTTDLPSYNREMIRLRNACCRYLTGKEPDDDE